MDAEPRRFEDFIGSEHARFFGALCLVTGDRHEAEEIMQDAFLRLSERWAGWVGLTIVSVSVPPMTRS